MFNPYQLFAIKEDFAVNQEEVLAVYLELQKKYHPDNFAQESSSVQLEMLQKSTDINLAYEVLKDDIKRAQCLIDIAKNKEAFTETVVKDNCFIMEQFQLRSKVDSLKSNFDFDEFLKLNDKADALYEENVTALATCFAEGDYNKAQMGVHRLQFLRKLKTELNSLNV